MEPMQDDEGKTPFQDLTNTLNGGGQATTNSQAQVEERAQRKRAREKARHAAMTQEQRDERNKKQREKYHQRKAEAAAAGSRGVGVESNKENTNATKIKSERVKARLAAMTQEERNEQNRKRREQYHQKKAEVRVESTTENTDGYDDSDWLHRNHPMQIDEDNTYEHTNTCINQSEMIDLTDASPDLNQGAISTSCTIDNIVSCPKERRREQDRARRATMSPEQKMLMSKRRRELYAINKL